MCGNKFDYVLSFMEQIHLEHLIEGNECFLVHYLIHDINGETSNSLIEKIYN